MLVIPSFFENKYRGNDNIERSTPFDNGYVLNVLIEREFNVGKEENNAFIIDTKITTSGGTWYTPVDLERSRILGTDRIQKEFGFTQQYDDFLEWDLKF